MNPIKFRLAKEALTSVFRAIALIVVAWRLCRDSICFRLPKRGTTIAVRTSSRWSFRLSHSGDRVLGALATAGLVGVDVERIRPRKEWDELASFALHPAERERIDALQGAARWRGFYRAWTLKEAMAKALGIGLALPFNRISFSTDNCIEAAPREGSE